MLLSGLVVCISETELLPQCSIFVGSDLINVGKSAVVSGMYASRGINIGRKCKKVQ
jgi:hypothetical protein